MLTVTNAQNSLFKNISTTDQYTEYRSVVDKDNDGVYEIRDRQFVVKFKTKTLPTGEGYNISAIVDKGSYKGKESTIDVVEGSFTCSGYPYESLIRKKSKKEGIVAIGDYIFFLKGVSDDGTSFTGIDDVYIKEGASGEKKEKKKGNVVNFSLGDSESDSDEEIVLKHANASYYTEVADSNGVLFRNSLLETVVVSA